MNCLTPSIVRDTPLYDKLMADPFASRLFGKAESMAKLGVAGPGAAKTSGDAISVTGGIPAI